MTLRNSAISAGRWTASAVVLRALVQVCQTAALARLLQPSDFGLMAMSSTVVAFAALFSDLGLSSALIHFPPASASVRLTLYVLNLGMGLALAALTVAFAFAVAALYNQPALVPLLALLSLAFPINAVGQQLRALAEKDFRFSTLAKIEVGSSIVALLASVVAAAAGAGVYALAIATLVAATVNSCAVLTSLGARPERPLRFDLEGAKPYLTYGGHRVGEKIWNTLLQQLDIAIASVVAGPGAVAFYATPRQQCLRIANTIVNPVITRIGLPVMARLQGDEASLRAVYMQVMRFTASLNFPAYALLAIFPLEFVTLLFGAQWAPAVPYLRIFALWGLIRSTANPAGSLVYAVGLVRRAHAWNFLNFLIAVPLLWTAERTWGLHGMAWTMLYLQGGSFVLAWWFLIRPACQASFWEYASQLVAPLIATAIATLVSLAAVSHLAPLWRLSVGVMIFLAAYVAASISINRDWIRVIFELTRPAFRVLQWRRP